MLHSVAFAALVGAGLVMADSGTGAPKCSLTNKCPEEAPCCSQFGECGVGAYCLGGCDPRMSFSIEACAPAPVCQDTTTNFNNLDSIADITEYLGDASKADWVGQGQIKNYKDAALLTMPKNSGGSLISSTSYMWYGNVKAKFKTSRGKGVVTAFILFSDIKDEIDYEFVGVDLETAQTNYYFQGVTDYHNSGNISLSDTFMNYHEYEIRWTPDQIDWLVDGQVGRTKKRADTWNETSQQWMFPQTPSRVQLSLWPGGLATNPKGTTDWAGGIIDWDAPDIKNAGYYWATIESITIECYDAKTPPGTNSGKSYVYESLVATNNTVQDTDKDTILGSFQATGLDMDKGKEDSKPSGTGSTTSAAAPSASNIGSIPGGGQPAGSTGQDHSGGTSGSSGSSSGSGSSSSSSSGSSSTANCGTSSFHSSCDSGSSSSGDSTKPNGSHQTSASALAIIIAGCALFWL